MLKHILRTLLFYVVAFSMLSAAVPLHSIVHDHYFVQEDTCGKICRKHLKTYQKPCCTTSDAVFIGELPLKAFTFSVNLSATKIECVYHIDNYFQFFHRTRNKAPPVLS
nr:hypothetical protein [uncultured Pedobacter sp.]